MLELILPTYHFALTYAQKLVADIPNEQMCAQPVPGKTMNHAAWTIGHLAWAVDNGVTFLGQQSQLAHLKDLCGMASKPSDSRSSYPPKAQLIDALAAAHERLAVAVRISAADAFTAPPPDRMRARFPTVGHLLAGLMTSHYGNHLGQLSAWRRAMGFPSVF